MLFRSGGTYTGDTLTQNAPAHVNAPTTISTSLFDFDGFVAPPTLLDADLTLNVDKVDIDSGNTYHGTVGWLSPFATLAVNLNNPGDHWSLSGTLDIDGHATILHPHVAGSDLVVNPLGAILASGVVGLDARIGLLGDITTADALTEVHLLEIGRAHV